MLIQSWVWGSPQLWAPVRKPRIHTQAMVRMTSRIGPRQVWLQGDPLLKHEQSIGNTVAFKEVKQIK